MRALGEARIMHRITHHDRTSHCNGGGSDYGRQRLFNFGITMMVMGVSFLLYYLGFFGNVEGPLQPEKLGAALGDMGVSRSYLVLFLLFLAVIAITWNWMYNLISMLSGTRMTCTKKIGNMDKVCGASVTRQKIQEKGAGRHVYACAKGHKCRDALFNPLKKGTTGHIVWATLLLFCVIIMLS